MRLGLIRNDVQPDRARRGDARPCSQSMTRRTGCTTIRRPAVVDRAVRRRARGVQDPAVAPSGAFDTAAPRGIPLTLAGHIHGVSCHPRRRHLGGRVYHEVCDGLFENNGRQL